MGKLDSAVKRFDKALEDVRAAVQDQRAEADKAESHVEDAVANFESEGGAVVAPKDEVAPADNTDVVAQPEPVYQPPVQ